MTGMMSRARGRRVGDDAKAEDFPHGGASCPIPCVAQLPRQLLRDLSHLRAAQEGLQLLLEDEGYDRDERDHSELGQHCT